MGDARRLAFPRPHEARPSARRFARASGPSSAPPGAGERRAARSLHGDQPWRAAHQPGGDGHGEALREGAGEGAAAHLDEERVDLGASRGDFSAISKARVRAPSTARPLSGPCTLKEWRRRDRAVARRERRIAGLARRRARRASTSAPRSLSAPHDGRLGVGGDEHVQRPVGCPGEHCGGERGVAAGGDRQPPLAQAFAERQAGLFQDRR